MTSRVRSSTGSILLMSASQTGRDSRAATASGNGDASGNDAYEATISGG
jgi:hypothetical protein